MELYNSSIRSLYVVFYDSIHHSMGIPSQEDVEQYLANLLTSFIHTDAIFAIRNQFGERLFNVTDMIEESDVLLNANSFEREREVHKHIGDFILFWTGIYPHYLEQKGTYQKKEPAHDYVQLGKESYYVASTFDYEPYKQESQIYRRLSIGFEDYANCLREVSKSLHIE